MKHNYKTLGLKSGLEIHQQLDTHKLFCNCPSLLRQDKPLREIKRTLNPVIGETGIVDIAVEHEAKQNKNFTYQVYDTNCLVETDEEPPHLINQEALKTALQIAHLLNCKIFPTTQIMRKTVTDGSNTSGFQRTVLLAHDGHITISSGKKIAIDYLMLEEDSARKATPNSEYPTPNNPIFKLDRLGIPLVEIATGPHMNTPEEIKEAALKLGEILRACKVKRGIGTIRQDVNISIKGSKRVEIKGFQDPKMMTKTIDLEIERQIKCIKEKTCTNEVRNALPNGTTEFLRPMPGAARMYPETDHPLLKISRDLINETKRDLPKLQSENNSYLKEFGLNPELIKLILKKNKLEDFKTLIHEHNNPNLVAKMLTLFQTKPETSIHNIEEILEKIENKEIPETDAKTIMQKISQGIPLKEAIKKSDIDLESETQKIIKQKPGLSQGAYMGLLMGKFKGQISGKEIADILKKLI
ncbi:Glu-tRNA(Gln) amidotransferase subunit GatE [archaeon]|jgi:Glu-tRNA(Gln) amidotransferase subunit E-like FAD-binding protein|nr:Glu-tRNA(Gln) amidotransferase subunit GatE [archaeon]MBT7128352.1 Glu-tRNA(Gln) amidotransferase subunit GatE [archaeon]